MHCDLRSRVRKKAPLFISAAVSSPPVGSVVVILVAEVFCASSYLPRRRALINIRGDSAAETKKREYKKKGASPSFSGEIGLKGGGIRRRRQRRVLKLKTHPAPPFPPKVQSRKGPFFEWAGGGKSLPEKGWRTKARMGLHSHPTLSPSPFVPNRYKSFPSPSLAHSHGRAISNFQLGKNQHGRVPRRKMERFHLPRCTTVTLPLAILVLTENFSMRSFLPRKVANAGAASSPPLSEGDRPLAVVSSPPLLPTPWTQNNKAATTTTICPPSLPLLRRRRRSRYGHFHSPPSLPSPPSVTPKHTLSHKAMVQSPAKIHRRLPNAPTFSLKKWLEIGECYQYHPTFFRKCLRRCCCLPLCCQRQGEEKEHFS